jgi:hypothetical protein
MGEMPMKRLDSVKVIYNTLISNDILLSMAAEEDLTDEERAELEEQLRKLQEQQEELEREKTELEEPEEPEITEETPEEPKELEEVFDELKETPSAEAPVVPSEPEEEIPEEEKIEMPSQLEKGQITWVETESGLGMLKKYSPNSVLAKTCPVCNYQNRPIYVNECENCDKVFKRLKRYIAIKKKQNKEFTPEMAFRDFAPRYKYLGPQALKEIYETKGKTELKEVNEIPTTPRKQLEDILWYRLNVEKDPRSGEPKLDKYGKPIPLENRKYFSTAEMTEALHISPEMLRSMVAEHNEKIINNLPPEAKSLIKKDDNGEIVPSSARQLGRYGFVAPAVVMGTGMADVRRRVTKEQEEKLSPEQVEGIKGPAFKSVDIAAWDWDKLKTVFGWDEASGKFTHGWMKFLREKFLPAIRKHSIENKIGALKRVINLYKKIATSQREDVKTLWQDNKNKGLRVHTYFHYNPEVDIEEFKNEWRDTYETYKQNHWKVVQKNTVDDKVPPDVKQILKNYDNAKEPLGVEERQALVDALATRLGVSTDKVEEHLETRDEANELIFERPNEIEYMMFLDANPGVTKQSLKKKYDRRRLAFEKFVWAKKEAVAEQFEAKAERLAEKLPELEAELQESELPADFDLSAEVKKYYREQGEQAIPLDPDPEVDKDIKDAKKEIEKENPTPAAPSLESVEAPPPAAEAPTKKKRKKKKGSRMEQIIRLATGQLDLFGPKDEEEAETEKETKLPDESTWRVRRFSIEPKKEYSKVVTWLNTSSNKSESSLGSFQWNGKDKVENQLANEIGKYGYHNFGVLPGDTIYVTLTDKDTGLKQAYTFTLDESGNGPVTFSGIVPWKSIKLQPKENLPEPELSQEEKAEEAPVENFGKVKGKYFVYFEWNPDYSGQSNSYKAFFTHTPGYRTIEFEDMIKSKIEKHFGPKIVPLMHSTDSKRPDKTERKYVHITVIEPETERRRRFGAVFNRVDGSFVWHGTGGVTERKEKERRLNLEKNKSLKTEINLGLIKLEDLELEGDDDFKVVEKGEKDIKKPKEYVGITEKQREEIRQRREEKNKKLENLTPEEKAELETLEEERKTSFSPGQKEFIEPSGKKETPNVLKLVSKQGFIKKTILAPVIDITTNRPKLDSSGKVIKEEKVIKIPKTDSFLVSIKLNPDGAPTFARCDIVSASYKPTGKEYKKRSFPDVYNVVKQLIDKKRPNLRKNQLWEERKDLVEKQYEASVKKLYGEKTEAWSKGMEKEPYLPQNTVDMNIRPNPSCPSASAPFENACPEIKAAVNSLQGKPVSDNYSVYDWDQVKRKSSLENSEEVGQRRRKHDTTDFFADDKE